ncbi:hypothetical protein N658DRAFT_406398, partial [Parathielavia hyrcaniae]
PQRSERWGPEIYVNLEFRLSWGRKEELPKHHQATYRSRGPRERSPAFPRQVPAPNTNYLAAIHTFDQRQARLREMRRGNVDTGYHQMQEYYQGDQAQHVAHLQIPVIQEPERPTRADTRRPSSHERGRSAPPPIGENPWDVSVPPLATRHSDMTASTMDSNRKPLPARPSQFRLGEGRHPWSTWSVPDGFDPDALPQDDDDSNNNNDTHDDEYQDVPVYSAASPGPGNRNSATYATNPTMVSTFSPAPPGTTAAATTITTSSSPRRARDLETGRAKELGALSAALMTVDNGFESQWWYQGQRETVASSAASATTAAPDFLDYDDDHDDDHAQYHDQHHHHHQLQRQQQHQRPRPFTPDESPTPVVMPAGVVSPMTEAALSPAAAPATTAARPPAAAAAAGGSLSLSSLQRSMSTRSEELWF